MKVFGFLYTTTDRVLETIFFYSIRHFFAINWSPPEFRIGLRPFCVVESWEVIGETCGADDDDAGDVVGDDDDVGEFW